MNTKQLSKNHVVCQTWTFTPDGFCIPACLKSAMVVGFCQCGSKMIDSQILGARPGKGNHACIGTVFGWDMFVMGEHRAASVQHCRACLVFRERRGTAGERWVPKGPSEREAERTQYRPRCSRQKVQLHVADVITFLWCHWPPFVWHV